MTGDPLGRQVLKAFLPLHSVRILDLCSAPGSKVPQNLGRAPTHLWCWYVLVPPKNWIHGYTVGFLNKNCPKKKAVDHSD